MTTALDNDERLHSEVGLKQERESTSTTDLHIVQSAYGRKHYLKRRRQSEKALRSGESADKRFQRLQRKSQCQSQLRSIESADDRLERLQRRRQSERQLRTIESANDRLERLQRRRQSERQLRTIESANDRLERLQQEAQRKCQLRTVESANKKLERLQRRTKRKCQLGTVRSPNDRLQLECLQRKRQPKGHVTTNEGLPLLQRRRQIWHQQKTTDSLRQKGKHVKSTRTDEVHRKSKDVPLNVTGKRLSTTQDLSSTKLCLPVPGIGRCECEGQTSCQCCTNVETITLTSILNLPRTKSDMCTFCNDEAVTGSVHGNDCHSSCTVSQEYDTSTATDTLRTVCAGHNDEWLTESNERDASAVTDALRTQHRGMSSKITFANEEL